MFFSGLSAALALGFAVGANGQSTTPYTDPATGITFQRYEDISGYSFGIALPETPTTDFIGQVVTPLTSGTGWGGVSFGGRMVSTLLLTNFANGNQVQGSLREAFGWSSPDIYGGEYGAASLSPICSGNSVNSTHITYTFVCKGCIIGDGFTFAATDTSYVLGYAISSSAPDDPTNPNSGIQYHDIGFGQYNADLEGAKSAQYDSWAALASGVCAGESSSPPVLSSSTAPPSASSSIPVSITSSTPPTTLATVTTSSAGAATTTRPPAGSSTPCPWPYWPWLCASATPTPTPRV